MGSRALPFLGIGAFLSGLVAAPASAAVFSGFDTGADGWTIADVGSTTATAADPNNPPTYRSTGGNPGGYIFTNDTENAVAFLAPGTYAASLGTSTGGSISFDLFDLDTPDAVNYPAVVIYGNGISIGYNTAGPGASFTHYVVPLTATGWTLYPGNGNGGTVPVTDAQFAAVLNGATNLAILADWHTGGDDTGLDNVSLSGPAVTAVPEPTTWASMLAGLAGVGAALRRGRRSPAGLIARRA